VQNTLVKLLMNSLYGKFGQRGFNWVKLSEENLRTYYSKLQVDYPEEYEDSPPTLRLPHGSGKQVLLGMNFPTNFRIMNDYVQFMLPTLEHPESFTAIAGFVTAYARARLLELCVIAGQKHVYYTDTDSLFVDETGFRNLKRKGELDDNGLGKLKIEGTDINVQFNGLKDYCFGSRTVIKGIRGNAIKLSEGTYQQDSFEGIRSVLNREPKPFIAIKQLVKRVDRKYSKGHTQDSGWVRPFVITDPDFIPLS